MELLKSQYTLPSLITQIQHTVNVQPFHLNTSYLYFCADFLVYLLVFSQSMMVSLQNARAFSLLFIHQLLAISYSNHVVYINVSQSKITSLVMNFVAIFVSQSLIYLVCAILQLHNIGLDQFYQIISLDSFYVFLFGFLNSSVKLLININVSIIIFRLEIFINFMNFVVVASFRFQYTFLTQFFLVQTCTLLVIFCFSVFKLKKTFLRESSTNFIPRINKFLLIQSSLYSIIFNFLDIFPFLLYQFFALEYQEFYQVQIMVFAIQNVTFYFQNPNYKDIIDFLPFAFLNAFFIFFAVTFITIEVNSLQLFLFVFLIQTVTFLSQIWQSTHNYIIKSANLFSVIIDKVIHKYDVFGVDTLIIFVVISSISQILLFWIEKIKQKKNKKKQSMLN